MQYIKMKDGRIIDLDSKRISSYEIVDDKTAMEKYSEEKGFILVYYFDEDEGEHLERDDKGGHSMDNWYLDDITTQVDSVEELCDFICYKIKKGGLAVAKITKDFPMEELRKARRSEEIEYARLMNIVGKDFICVAEMDEKGEFELI